MKKLLLNSLLLAASALPLSVHANCTPFNGWHDHEVLFRYYDTIYVQRDTPDQTVLFRYLTAFGSARQYAHCIPPYVFEVPYRNGWAVGPDSIAATNVQGVGVRISLVYQDGRPSRYIPFDTRGEVNNGPVDLFWAANAHWLVEVIKTGPIPVAGTLPAGLTAGVTDAGNYWIQNLYSAAPGHIIPVACSILNTAIQVPLGKVDVGRFKGVGTTVTDADFQIPLTCNAGTRIQITLDGTGHRSGAPGVLALDGASGARGVGVQVLRNGVPVAYGRPIAVGTAANDGNYNIPLVARYYQTDGVVVPGQANSAATFTMTYN